MAKKAATADDIRIKSPDELGDQLTKLTKEQFNLRFQRANGQVERRFTHPMLGKTVRRSKRYHAHDENGQFKIGDLVRIRECRPLSKLKTWEVVGRVGDEG
jgi:ribosomal protein uS17